MRDTTELCKCYWCECTYIRSTFPHLVFPREMNEKYGQEYKVSKYKKYCSEDCLERQKFFDYCNFIEKKHNEKKNGAL